jgi:hypothetical protein
MKMLSLLQIVSDCVPAAGGSAISVVLMILSHPMEDISVSV